MSIKLANVAPQMINRADNKTDISDTDVAKLVDQIKSVEYGSVTVKIHDAKIVLIEKSETIKP